MEEQGAIIRHDVMSLLNELSWTHHHRDRLLTNSYPRGRDRYATARLRLQGLRLVDHLDSLSVLGTCLERELSTVRSLSEGTVFWGVVLSDWLLQTN